MLPRTKNDRVSNKLFFVLFFFSRKQIGIRDSYAGKSSIGSENPIFFFDFQYRSFMHNQVSCFLWAMLCLSTWCQIFLVPLPPPASFCYNCKLETRGDAALETLWIVLDIGTIYCKWSRRRFSSCLALRIFEKIADWFYCVLVSAQHSTAQRCCLISWATVTDFNHAT